MSTVATLIDRALRVLGQINSGETASDDEYADGLVAINALQDSWRNEGLTCFATQTESLTLSASTTSYTIGPSGTLTTTRPLDIEAAYILDNNVSYWVTMITDADYDGISDKTVTSSWPDRANYRPTMPNGTLYVYPPANATRTLKLRTRVPLTAFNDVTDNVSLPPGWEEALAYNLAVDIAPEYQVDPPQAVIRRAIDSLAALKRANSRPLTSSSEVAAMFNGHKPNIITGT